MIVTPDLSHVSEGERKEERGEYLGNMRWTEDKTKDEPRQYSWEVQRAHDFTRWYDIGLGIVSRIIDRLYDTFGVFPYQYRILHHAIHRD